MVSVSRINSATLESKRVQSQKNLKHSNVVSLNASNPNILQDYLSLIGKQNLAVISFGKQVSTPSDKYQTTRPMDFMGVTPYGKDFSVDAFRPGISDYAKWKIRTEAARRINGDNKWPEIKNINAWMVSAETDKFMSVGGLSKVAADLPASFNQRFKGDSKNSMSNVTPLYLDNNKYKLEQRDGKFVYIYGRDAKTKKDKELELNLLGSISVPIYNPSHNIKQQDTLVRVFEAYVNDSADPTAKGTKYIFLDTPAKRKDEYGNEVDNAQIFNVQDKDPKSTNNGTAYANNIYGTDEVFRMAFFSKATYELMKDIKEGHFKNLEAPNSVLLNDWHAGPLAAMMHYTANAEADNGDISKDTGKYFDETPTFYIAHNVEYQGATNGDDNKRTSVFATLFGPYAADIVSNSKSWDQAFSEDNNALMRYSNFNSAMSGLTLVDRVVPVSEHYGDELAVSNIKSNGMMHLMKARKYGHTNTLTPITNGYSKDKIAPTESHMTELLKNTQSDFTIEKHPEFDLDFSAIKFVPYSEDNMSGKNITKNAVMDIFKQTIERERKILSDDSLQSDPLIQKRRYVLHDPFNTELPDIKDFSQIPVMAFSGRVDPQKGLDTILKDALWNFAEHNKNTPSEKLPIFIIGGKITQQESYNALARMKDEMREKYPNVAKRIILIKDFVRTDMLTAASDMFFVPSVFEPCGLTQLEAMAKGSLPIATSTGGLVNTINDGVDGFRTKAFFDQQGWETKGRIYGEGFSTNGEAYCEAMERALDTFYNDGDKFKEMQKLAMQNDFSWDRPDGALDKYINLIKTGKTN